MKLNNGLIIQWGVSQVTYANAQVLTSVVRFMQAYTSTPTVVASVNSSDNNLKSLTVNAKLYNIETGKFIVAIHNSSGSNTSSTSIPIMWIAIGY